MKNKNRVQCYTCGKYHYNSTGLKHRKFGGKQAAKSTNDFHTLILFYCPECPVKTPVKPRRGQTPFWDLP